MSIDVEVTQPTPEEEPWRDPKARPFIQIEGVSKHFGDFVAVDKVDLEIYKGELFSILGGSGCGKTTLLRILAGFEIPSAGRVTIDGVDMTGVPPYERPVNIMFQSYALFPHMSVVENVAYGLKKERMPQAEVEERVAAILELVKLVDFGKRKPDQLSGGQRQRVALARALVKQPKVLLLDEPLAALDKKLREHTQFELANIQDELGITFVVVTHDQEEAMTLSTRIAIMNAGRFTQIGTPREVYEYPRTRYAADFIGTINMFEGTVAGSEGAGFRIRCEETGIELSANHEGHLPPGAPVCVAVRPEKIMITKEAPKEPGKTVVKGTVLELGYFGNLSVYLIKMPTGKIVRVSAQNRIRTAKRTLAWDDEVFLSWDQASAVLLTD